MQVVTSAEQGVLARLGLRSKVWTVSYSVNGVVVIGKRQKLLNRRARLVLSMSFQDVKVVS